MEILEISKLEQHKANIDETMKSTSMAINEVFSDMFYERFITGQDVNFDLLQSVLFDKVVSIPEVKGGYIYTKRVVVKNPNNNIRYYTDWSPGATAVRHCHSDANEKITSINGRYKWFILLENGTTDTGFLNPGEFLEISAGVWHQITAITGGNLQADFTKVS